MKNYYIGLDVHCNKTELAIEQNRKIIGNYSVPTSIRAIREVLGQFDGHKHVTFEEGTMSGWLYRNLKDHVKYATSCDPRRNKMIFDNADDKNDPIDARKLAQLLRGRFIRPVYHSEDEDRVEFKYWVGMYHSRVLSATRNINKLRAHCRLYGIKIPSAVMRRPDERVKWLGSLKNEHLASRLELIWMSLDSARYQVHKAKAQLLRLSRKYPIIKHWSQLPGVGIIRSVTLFAYLDTPFRFKTKSKLWKYCGLGLVRDSSGNDKNGQPRKGKLKLGWYCNKRLKDVVMGAAMSAIHGKDNYFKDMYENMRQSGKFHSNARRAVARKMLTIMWGMWKSGNKLNPDLM